MNREEVISRLCRLKCAVWSSIVDASEPCDCVCHEKWEKNLELSRKYGDMDPCEHFRHGDSAIEFIERAVLDALKNYKPPFVPENCDEGDA